MGGCATRGKENLGPAGNRQVQHVQAGSNLVDTAAHGSKGIEHLAAGSLDVPSCTLDRKIPQLAEVPSFGFDNARLPQPTVSSLGYSFLPSNTGANVSGLGDEFVHGSLEDESQSSPLPTQQLLEPNQVVPNSPVKPRAFRTPTFSGARQLFAKGKMDRGRSKASRMVGQGPSKVPHAPARPQVKQDSPATVRLKQLFYGSWEGKQLTFEGPPGELGPLLTSPGLAWALLAGISLIVYCHLLSCAADSTVHQWTAVSGFCSTTWV